MLWFEREVVGALVASPDPAVRSAVEAFVDGSLRDMPEPIRLGVVGETVLLGGYVAALRLRRRVGDAEIVELLDRWEASPIGLLRQWPRMMRSLVLFAENELVEQEAA
jgi:hypothetical protein